MRVFGVMFGIILILLFLLGNQIKAHDAPSGWTYPVDCCSNLDCYPISWADIEITPEGWLIKDTGQIVPFDKVQNSPDGEFHICVHGGDQWQSNAYAAQWGGMIIGSPGTPHWCPSRGKYTESCPDGPVNPENPDRSLWCIWVPTGT